MSLIGKNIRKIRTIKKLSQASFAQLFNLARPSVGAYEEGRAEPKLDTVIQIANYFGLPIDALLTKELTVNELYHFETYISKFHNNHIEPKPNLVSIPLVNHDVVKQYVNSYEDESFLRALPAFQFPREYSNCERAFMLEAQNAFSKIIFCKKVYMKDLKMNWEYILITNTKILFVSYIGKDGVYKFIDRMTSEEKYFDESEVQEVWLVKYMLKRVLMPNIQERSSYGIDARLDLIEHRLDKIEKELGQQSPNML